MLKIHITDLLTFLEPYPVAGLVLMVVAAYATYLLVRGRGEGMTYLNVKYKVSTGKVNGSFGEGTISLELRRAVDELMHN
ncbi:hypothetical protein [Maridesulfovibrio sp. FT414]|uniref:hypothetical protein n=1 Tax=Maridesulfovibrio sp. FT414 TaxID=2979469 RepID=UPI003D809B19